MKTNLPRSRRGYLTAFGLAAGSVITLAACSSSTHSSAPSAPTTTSGSPASVPAAPAGSSPAAGVAAAVTISAANVPGYGTVLVNGSGRTLYMLTSEQGGKITCTDANGCTRFWPDTELPQGTTAATAGSGIQSSLLGTLKDSAGSLYVTYGSWPLYTFSGDTAAGQAHGEGAKSFGGTWYVLGASGQPVTSKSSTSSQGAGAYGY